MDYIEEMLEKLRDLARRVLDALLGREPEPEYEPIPIPVDQPRRR